MKFSFTKSDYQISCRMSTKPAWLLLPAPRQAREEAGPGVPGHPTHQSKRPSIRSKLNTDACGENSDRGRRAPGALVAPPEVRRVGLPRDRGGFRGTRPQTGAAGIARPRPARCAYA